MLRTYKTMVLTLALLPALPGVASAGAITKAIREAAEWIGRKFGSRVAREGAEALAPRLERLVAKHGDEVLPLAKRIGPEFLEGMERAGPHADEVFKLFSRRGDEAVWITSQPRRLAMFVRYGSDVEKALIRHRTLAEQIIEKFGGPGGRALAKLNGKQARRLVDMSQYGELARIGRTDALLDVIARFGDRGCDFVWRNKGALATASVLAAFLADPEPFIDGGHELAHIAIEHIAAVLTEASGQVTIEAARNVNWTLIGVVLLVVAIPGVCRRVLRTCRGEATQAGCLGYDAGETPALRTKQLNEEWRRTLGWNAAPMELPGSPGEKHPKMQSRASGSFSSQRSSYSMRRIRHVS